MRSLLGGPGLFRWRRSQEWTALLLSGPVPQSEFDPVANANLVVAGAQVVPDNKYADPEFGRDFLVLQSVRHQLYDSSLASAELPGAVQRPLLDRQFPPPRDNRERGPVKFLGKAA
jgi:hypothetical protein